MPPQRRPLEHGTYNGYNTQKCRCEPCRAANNAYAADLRRRKRAGEPVAKKSRALTHGTAQGYSRGCRCDPCSAARRVQVAEWKLRTGRTETSRILTPPKPPQPALDVAAVLEARARALALAIAAAPRSTAGLEARHRRAEVLSLLAHLKGATA